jgi:hypothetical protein
VGLDPLPDGIGPERVWQVELTVLQHGRTPLEDVEPRVIVTRGDARDAFPARATSEPGVYRAEVVFPSAGTWRYAVDDGFTQTHTFPPVRVVAGGGPRAPAHAGDAQPGSLPAVSSADDGAGAVRDGGGGGLDLRLVLAIAAASGVAAALAGIALRRRRPPPAAAGG